MSNVEKLMMMFDTLDKQIKQDRDKAKRELTAAIAERDAARECLREVLHGLEDLLKSMGHKNPREFKDIARWRAGVGLEGAK